MKRRSSAPARAARRFGNAERNVVPSASRPSRRSSNASPRVAALLVGAGLAASGFLAAHRAIADVGAPERTVPADFVHGPVGDFARRAHGSAARHGTEHAA